MINDRPPRYRAYMLRCWEVRPGQWCFSLQCVQSGRKRGFPDLAGLVAFLEGELDRFRNGPARPAPVKV